MLDFDDQMADIGSSTIEQWHGRSVTYAVALWLLVDRGDITYETAMVTIEDAMAICDERGWTDKGEQ